MKKVLTAIETAAAVFLLLIALVTAANVAVRGAFNTQIPDWFDGSKLLLGIALFWGIAVATYHAGHICVDIVWEHLKPGGRRVLDLIAGVITLAFLAPMAWMVLAKVLASGTQTTTDLRLPVMPFNLLAGCGVVAALVLGLARLWQLAHGHDPHDELAAAAAAQADAVVPGTGGSGHVA